MNLGFHICFKCVKVTCFHVCMSGYPVHAEEGVGSPELEL